MATATTWHHPHFVSAQRDSLGVRYEFRAFAGDEPEPSVPAEVEALREHGYSTDPDSPWAAYRAALDEVQAANTLWRAARYVRDVTGRLREILPVWQAYRRARAAVDAAYAALDETPDGQWRSALLRLVTARATVLDAAATLDAYTVNFDEWDHGVPERVLEHTPSLHEIARAAGLDLTGWDPFGLSTTDDLEREFADQDKRIAAAARLAGDEPGTRR